MHPTAHSHTHYRLYGRDGEIHDVNSIADLVELFGGRRCLPIGLFGQAFANPDPIESLLDGKREVYYILRDQWDDPVPAEEIAAWLKATRPLPAWLKRRYPAYRYRRGPVPHIRKCRGGNGYFRTPRTTHEIRAWSRLETDAAEAAEAGVRLKARARRSSAMLPTAWDDFWRESQRSWKKQRRTQYRAWR